MNEHSKKPQEFSDKTVEKAIEAACEYFKCNEEDLEIEIITRGSTGLFGLGGRKAKITARPTKEYVEASSLEKDITDKAPEEGRIAEKAIPEGAEKEPDRDTSAQIGPQATPAAEKKTVSKRKKEEIPPELIEKQLHAACDIANEILEKSGLDGRAEVIEQTNKPYINITGKDLSLIIGKDGKTLDALEYLINLCLRKKGRELNYRVALEAGGYRERRRKGLKSLAEKMASKAKKTGKAISLQPMPARERRIVHLALRGFKGVRTHSSGEGGGRKVIITPLRNRRRAKKNRK